MGSPRTIVISSSHNQQAQVLRLELSLRNHLIKDFLLIVSESGNHWSNESENIVILRIPSKNYWCGAISNGLNYAEKHFPDSNIIICNSDVILKRFSSQLFKYKFPVAAYTIVNGKTKKSGFYFSSLINGYHFYPNYNIKEKEITSSYVDVVPCRFVMFNSFYLKKYNLKLSEFMPIASEIPHYGADFVFTANISRISCKFKLDKDLIVIEDESTTGQKNLKSLKDRISAQKNIKSPFERKAYKKTLESLALSSNKPIGAYVLVGWLKYLFRIIHGK